MDNFLQRSAEAYHRGAQAAMIKEGSLLVVLRQTFSFDWQQVSLAVFAKLDSDPLQIVSFED
jgi:hypothetical protein